MGLSLEDPYLRIFNLEEELEAKSLSLHYKDETIQALKAKISEIYVEFHNSKDELTKQADIQRIYSEKCRQNIENLLVQMRDISCINSTLITGNKDLKSRVSVLTDQIETLKLSNRNTSKDVIDENESLKAEIEDLTNKNAVKSVEINRLETKITEFASKIEFTEEKADNAVNIKLEESHLAELNEKMSKSNILVEKISKMEEELAEMGNLTFQLDSTKNANLELDRVVKLLKQDNLHLTAKIANLTVFEDERPSLVNQMLVVQTEYELATKTIGKQTEQIKRLMADFDNISSIKQEYEVLNRKLLEDQSHLPTNEDFLRIKLENDHLRGVLMEADIVSQLAETEKNSLLLLVEDLREVNKSSLNDISNLEAERDELKRAACFLNSNQEQLLLQLNQLISEKDETKIIVINNEMRALRGDLSELESCRQKLVSEKEELEKSVNIVKGHNFQLECEISKNKKTIENLCEERETQINQIIDLTGKVSLNEGIVCGLRSESEGLFSYIHQLNDSYNSLWGHSKELQSNLVDMTDERDQLRNTRDQLNHLIQSLEEKLTHMQDNYEDSLRNADKLKQEADILKLNYEQLRCDQQDSSSLKEHLSVLENENKSNEKAVNILQSEKEQQFKVLNLLEHRNLSLQEEINKIRAGFMEYLKDAGLTEQETLFDQAQFSVGDRNVFNEDVLMLEDGRKLDDRTLSLLRTEKDQLVRSVNLLEHQNSLLNANWNQLNEEYICSLNELGGIKKERDLLRITSEEFKRERNILTDRILKLETEIESNYSTLANLRSEIDNLIENRDFLRDQNTSLSADLTKIKENYEDCLRNVDVERRERDMLKFNYDQLKCIETDSISFSERIMELEEENKSCGEALSALLAEKEDLLQTLNLLERKNSVLEANIRAWYPEFMVNSGSEDGTIDKTEYSEMESLSGKQQSVTDDNSLKSLEEQNLSLKANINRIKDYQDYSDVDKMNNYRINLEEYNENLVCRIRDNEETFNTLRNQIYYLERSNHELTLKLGEINVLRERTALLEEYILTLNLQKCGVEGSESTKMFSKSSFDEQSYTTEPQTIDSPNNFPVESDLQRYDLVGICEDYSRGESKEIDYKLLIDEMVSKSVNDLWSVTTKHTQNYEDITSQYINIAAIIKEIKQVLSILSPFSS